MRVGLMGYVVRDMRRGNVQDGDLDVSCLGGWKCEIDGKENGFFCSIYICVLVGLRYG